MKRSRVSRRKSIRRVRKGYRKVNKRINKKAVNTQIALRNANLGQGFPDKLTMTHRYVERVTLTNAAPSAVQTGHFSCNGLYDPNTSGTGHQPIYFDQLTAIYDQYCVILSKIKITFTNTGTVPCYAGVFLNDDTAMTGTTYYDASEQSNSKIVLLGARDSGSATRTIVRYWGVRKWFGKSPLANDVLRGTSTTNPTEQMHFMYWTQPIDATTVETVYATAQIEYVTVWTELKDIATS